jgi:hypothetical protein
MKFSFLPLLLSVLVSPSVASNLNITTKSLPNGTAETRYSAVIQANGGCTPDQWTIASGKLPAGVTSTVSHTTKSLTLAGTPTTAATYSFTVKVTGCGGGTSEVAYTVVIQSSSNHVVDLSWKASTSNDVAGYNVYRGPDGVSWTKINVSLVPAILYSDSTVANGTTYYYAATAVDISGDESSKTAPVKAVVP